MTFRAQAVELARWTPVTDGVARALLVPDPANEHDPCAVKVIIHSQHVGWLSRHISPVIQPALAAFSAAHEERLVSCPAFFGDGSFGTRVTLRLDLAALGVDPVDVDYVPDLGQMIQNLLPRLAEPVPAMTRRDDSARRALAEAELDRATTDENYDRSPEDWPRVERAFRAAAVRLEAARDPLVSDAWLGVARATRYQRGRSDSMLSAAIEALYWNPASAEAWGELIARAAAAPHVSTLLDLFRRVPVDTRPKVLSQLIALSRGHDRLGNMHTAEGERLRAGLAKIAEAGGDKASITKLRRDARRHSGDGMPKQ